MSAQTIAERLKRQHEVLNRDASNKQELASLSLGLFEAEYDLTLFFDPFDFKCQRTQALLNYYSVSYRRVDSPHPELPRHLHREDGATPQA